MIFSIEKLYNGINHFEIFKDHMTITVNQRNFIILFFFILLFVPQTTIGQNNRLNTYNSVGWYNCFGNFKLSEKLGIHTEYQWRRNHLISNWQQSLLRFGVNYNYNSRVVFRLGYAWIETYPYGDYPINSLGRDYTEHRIFEMTQLAYREGIFDFSHKFILEQRFVGAYSSVNEDKEDRYVFLNRFRYMFRTQVPLIGKEIKNQIPYLAIYDEIFIGFGKNVTANVFDQNRLGLLIGMKINNGVKIEAGYINQILQFGRLINGRNVFQNNSGLIVNANFNFDLSKKNSH